MTDNFGVSSDPEIFEVEKILDSKILDGEQKFLIRWAGYNQDYDTWEPIQNLEGCEQKLEEFLASRTEKGEKNKENSRKTPQRNKKTTPKPKQTNKKNSNSDKNVNSTPISQPPRTLMTFSESSSSDSDSSHGVMLDFLLQKDRTVNSTPLPPPPVNTKSLSQGKPKATKERATKAKKPKTTSSSSRTKVTKETPKAPKEPQKTKSKSTNSKSRSSQPITENTSASQRSAKFVFSFNTEDEKSLPLQIPTLQNQKTLYHIVDSNYQFPSDFQLLSRIQKVKDAKVRNGKKEVLVQWAEEGAQDMWLPYDAVLGMDPQLLLDCLLEMYIEKRSEE